MPPTRQHTDLQRLFHLLAFVPKMKLAENRFLSDVAFFPWAFLPSTVTQALFCCCRDRLSFHLESDRPARKIPNRWDQNATLRKYYARL